MSARLARRVRTASAIAVGWLALAIAAPAATLDAALSAQSLASGQAVTLTLGSDAALPADIDLSPITQDFRVLDERRAETVRTVNGRRQVRHELLLTLLPRRTGALTVPPLAIADMASPALTLSVAATVNPDAQLLPAPTRPDAPPQATSPQTITASAEVSARRGVVGQEFVLTVRAISPDGPPTGRLLTPDVADARLLPLGTRRDRDAQGRQVLEQRFSVFPARTGRLQITDLGFDAWQPAGGEPVHHRLEPLTITVTAPPPDIDLERWLPAHEVSLTEAGPAEVRIAPGQGIERMLTLRAQGLMAEDLPAIPLEIPFQLRVRDDPPRLWNERTPEGVVGYRAERILISAPDPGRFVLPGPSIDWWDTEAATLRTATLADWTLTVAPFASADRRPAARWERDRVAAEQPADEASETAGAGRDEYSGSEATPTGGLAWAIALTVGVGLPVLALFAWLGLRRSSRKRRPPKEAVVPALEREPAVRSQADIEATIAKVRQAYAAADALAARSALLSWAAQVWPAQPPRNLSQLMLRVEPPLRDDVKLLDAAFYGPGDTSWAQSRAADRLAALVAVMVKPTPTGDGEAAPS